jgi:RNase P subunit RPR2
MSVEIVRCRSCSKTFEVDTDDSLTYRSDQKPPIVVQCPHCGTWNRYKRD